MVVKKLTYVKASSAGKCRTGWEHSFRLYREAEGKTGKLFQCSVCELVFEVESRAQTIDSTTGRFI